MRQKNVSKGRFPFDRTDGPDPAFERTYSTTPSNSHIVRMIYARPEECKGSSCKYSFKLLPFLCKLTGLASSDKRKASKDSLVKSQQTLPI